MPTKRRRNISKQLLEKQQTTSRTTSRKVTLPVNSSNGVINFIFSLDIRVIAVGILLIILLLMVLVDSICFAGKCYAGVRIGDVDVSGLNEIQAKEKVMGEYESYLNNKSIYIFTDDEAFNQVNLNDYFEAQNRIAEQISSLEEANNVHIFQTNAADVGAFYDYDTSINLALTPGHSLNIFERIRLRIFGTNYTLSLETGDGLDALYSSIASATGEPHTDYDVKVNKGEVSITQGKDGKAINRNKFSEGLIESLCTKSVEPQKLLFNIEDDPIVIDESKALDAKTRVEAIIETGASFNFQDKNLKATKSDLGAWITTQPNLHTSTLDVTFDDNKSKQGLSKLINDSLGVSTVSVSMQKGESGDVVINPTSEVSVPDLQAAVNQLKDNKLSNDIVKDTIYIKASDQVDNFDFETALQVGLITEIASYTTSFTNTSSTANRNHNIALVANSISNSIVEKEDGVFSFNTASGPTDAEHGYLEAGTQVGNQTVQEAGGGICQVATTVFNAVYDGGYPILERHSHTLRNLSYPAGRDAAVYVSNSSYELDLRWKNDTSSDVLLKSWSDDTSITVALYGVSPNRKVTSIPGEFEEGEKHEIIFTEDNTLSKGQYNIKTVGADGTKIDVVRKVYSKDGDLLYNNTFSSEYAKVDEEITVGPDTDTEEIKKSRS